MNNYLFYTIILDSSSFEIDYYVNLLINLKPDNTSNNSTLPLFLSQSEFISMTEYNGNTKVLMVLHNKELYYKDNYKYFDEFRQLFNTTLKQYNSLDNYNNIHKYNTIYNTNINNWEIENIKHYLSYN
jgi:hypothetical protein